MVKLDSGSSNEHRLNVNGKNIRLYAGYSLVLNFELTSYSIPLTPFPVEHRKKNSKKNSSLFLYRRRKLIQCADKNVDRHQFLRSNKFYSSWWWRAKLFISEAGSLLSWIRKNFRVYRFKHSPHPRSLKLNELNVAGKLADLELFKRHVR